MRAPSCRLPTLLVGTLSSVVLAGCTSTDSGTRWSRHFDGSVWGGALSQQAQHSETLAPEVALLATIPLSFAYDDQIQTHYNGDSVSTAQKDASDALQILLPAIPMTIGIVDWAHGDGGERFEVVAESLGAVVLAQQTLAYTVGRERPNGSDDKSFPSGHTSWAFSATTLIVRGLHDPSDDSFHLVDGLLYLPAAFAGWERVASDRHWTSDVVCGAFLGVFLTNWIWDAHYGRNDGSQPTIYDDGHHRGIAWVPVVDMVDGQLLLGISGGF